MKNLLLLSLAIFAITFSACKKDEHDDHDHDHDEEVITTLQLSFEDTLTGVVTVFRFNDPDGDGGDPAIEWDTIRLDENATYYVTTTVYNESGSTVEDVTPEIEEEGAEHLFCYTPDNINIDITLTDSDGTLPIGLTSTWELGTTGFPADASVKVELKHQADGEKDGSCAPGSTDIDVTFPVRINQ